jgi:hypothetical protein
MADQTMLARRQLRLAALAALQSANLGATIECPGDWTTPCEILPAILFRSPREHKESIAKTLPEFTTSITFDLEARVEANTAEAAQDAIEALGYQIEQALLTNQALIVLIQQVASIDTEVDITAEGRRHIGGVKMSFVFEVCEFYEPSITNSLEGISIHADLIAPFDATSTYESPAFPDAVPPAPRTSGPDGRDEGALDFDFTEPE